MTADQCVAFLQALGANHIRVKDNGWVEASCPLAPWLHEKHADHSPSFGLRIDPEGRSHYSCFACQAGSAEELLHAVELYAKSTAHQYNFALCHELLTTPSEVQPLPAYGEFPRPDQVFQEWPQYWLDSFTPVAWIDVANAYLLTRGVTVTQMAQHDLRFDLKRHMIVAPYRDVFGRLAGARGRSIHPETTGPGKHYDYSWQGSNNNRLVWYHEQALNLSGPAVIVEGQFDCWKTVQAYPKTLAALTAKPSWEKFKKLGDCPFIIQIPDTDKTGQMSTVLYAKYCAQLGIGYKAIWLDEGAHDPDDCAVGYLKDRIDALL